MSTKFYVKDNNGEFYSEDRKIRYRLLKGKQVIEDMDLAGRKRQKHFAIFNEKNSKI